MYYIHVLYTGPCPTFILIMIIIERVLHGSVSHDASLSTLKGLAESMRALRHPMRGFQPPERESLSLTILHNGGSGRRFCTVFTPGDSLRFDIC